jgi:hypothetical protein
LAAVVRDEEGNFLGASTLVVEENTAAEVVEAIACREGLALSNSHTNSFQYEVSTVEKW